jgi:hypothetical protein
MPETLKWSLTAEIAGGPKVDASRSVQITGYDKIDVLLDGAADLDSAAAVTVDIQPAEDVDRLQFLSITADRYGENFIYSVEDGGVADVVFDGPQVFVGEGAMNLLQSVPSRITFRNGLGAETTARVTILVGRQATA